MGGDAMLEAKAHKEKFYHFCSQSGGGGGLQLLIFAQQNKIS